MKRLLTATAGALMLSAAASAGINSPDAGGYLERGISMFNDNNYQGCLDQLGHLDKLSATPSVMEQAAYYKAMAAARMGDEEAITLIRNFLRDYPVTPLRDAAIAAAGDWHFDRGEYADALRLYRLTGTSALDNATAASVKYHTGFCYMALGEYDSARGLFESIASTPDYGNDARFYLAYLKYVDKDYNGAMSLFKTVDTSSAPGNAAPYYMAQIHFQQGDYTAARNLASRMISQGTVREFLPECNRIMGESLYNQGRESEAVPYLWKYCAEAKTPEPSAYYILGVSEYNAGHNDDAIKLLQQAIGTKSAMEQSAYLFLGQAYLKRGENNMALMAFENAAKVDFDRDVRETAFYNYAVARMEGGRVPFGNSVALLDDFLRQYPDSRYSADVQKYIITGYMTDNDYESALAAINRIKDPGKEVQEARQRSLFVLGTRDYSAGRIAQAIDRFTEARAVRGADSSVATQCEMWLGDCYYRQGSYDNAVACYRNYLSRTKSSRTEAVNRKLALYDLGYALFSAGDYKEAATAFNQEIKTSGDLTEAMMADTYNRLADCHYYLMDFDSALTGYRKAYELNPEAGDYALFQMAVMKGLTKEHKAKIELLDELAAKYPSSGLLASALLEKGESQSALGNTAGAIETYRQLATTYPGTAQGRRSYLQLAITHMNRGEKTDAVECYRKVISTYPSSEEARVASDDLKQIYAADGRLSEFASFISSIPDAPAFDAGEMEQLSFAAAENDFVYRGLTEKLTRFLADYPRSTRRPQAIYYLAEAAWNADNAEEALSYADMIVSSHPDSESVEDAMLIKGNAEAALGKTEPALATFKALESKASGSNILREARMGIITTATSLGRYADVVATADKMLSSTAASAGDDKEILFMRALAYNSMKEYDKAYADWKVLAANPDELNGAKSAYYMGQSQLDRGLLKDAHATADALISSNTPHRYWLARGFILFSDVLRSEGNTFEADEYLKSLQSYYPGTEAEIFQMINQRLK